jgi:hypothetical protein
MVNFYQTTIALGEDMLDLLGNSLVANNWTILDQTATTLNIQGTTENAHACQFEFKLATNFGLDTIEIRGYHDANYSSKFFLQYIPNDNNIIYLTCDNDSFALFISPPILTLVGSNQSMGNAITGGFLDRAIDSENDAFCWILGYIHSIPWGFQCAKSVLNNNWQQLWRGGAPYETYGGLPNMSVPYQSIANGIAQTGTHVPPHWVTGTCDRFTRSIYPTMAHPGSTTTVGWGPNTAEARFPASLLINGGVNALNGKPVLSPMFWAEGDVATGYGDNGSGYSKGIYYRGVIKHCFAGGASLPINTIVNDRANKQYISTGNLGWQMMKIS